MVNYANTSPWFVTPINSGNYLDIYQKRSIPQDGDDILYVIQPQYTYRPDLLAYDLYGTSKLWWVFAVRNMDTIKDPVFDFIAGTEIYLPKKSSLSAITGL